MSNGVFIMATKTRHDLTSFKDKIKPKRTPTDTKDVTERFARADKTLGVSQDEDKHMVAASSKAVKKTYSVPAEALELIELIKDRALNKKVVMSDSEVVRLGLLLAAECTEDDLVKFFARLETLAKGRPRLK